MQFVLIYELNLFFHLILYNQKPFLQFYDEYFKDLEIFRSRFNESYPNYEQNSIIVHFVLKNDKIFVKKKKFFVKIGDGSEEELYEPLRNYSSRNDEFEFERISKIKKTIDGLLSKEQGLVEGQFIFDKIKKGYKMQDSFQAHSKFIGGIIFTHNNISKIKQYFFNNINFIFISI